MKDLRIAVKAEYFYAIRSGEKVHEYRERTDYWSKRLVGKHYDTVTITLGYPRKGDKTREITSPYRGYMLTPLRHKQFGNRTVDVFAIHVGEKK